MPNKVKDEVGMIRKLINIRKEKHESDTWIRKEIGRVWGLKKTARNEKFNQIFGEPVKKDGVYKMASLSKSPIRGKSSEGLMYDEYTTSQKKKQVKPAVLKVNGDKATAEIKNSQQIYTLEQLIEVSGIDIKDWTVKRFTANSYGDNFQAKAEFERKLSNVTKLIIEELKADAENYSPKVNPIKYKPIENGKLLVVNIADAHLGKLSCKELASHNYDLKIAKEIYRKTLADLISKATKQGDFDKIWYVVGNDYLTIDTPTNTTTAGTPQETDTRFAKIFKEGRELLVETINELAKIAPVHVIVMPGNHDRTSMFHIGDALECWFRNDENVTVDNSEKLRKYYTYGKNAYGITHGDTIKIDKLPQMGLVEYGAEWGAAKRRYFFVGHVHHLKCQNIQGTEIWTFPSVSGSDEYHQSHGYVGSTRNALAMIFSKDNLEAVFQSQPVEDKDYQ